MNPRLFLAARLALVIIGALSIVAGAAMIAPEAGLLSIGALSIVALWDLSR